MMVATDAIFLDLVRFGDYLGMVQTNYSPKMDSDPLKSTYAWVHLDPNFGTYPI